MARCGRRGHAAHTMETTPVPIEQGHTSARYVPDIPPPVATTRPPAVRFPAGACDCHAHIFGPPELDRLLRGMDAAEVQAFACSTPVAYAVTEQQVDALLAAWAAALALWPATRTSMSPPKAWAAATVLAVASLRAALLCSARTRTAMIRWLPRT